MEFSEVERTILKEKGRLQALAAFRTRASELGLDPGYKTAVAALARVLSGESVPEDESISPQVNNICGKPEASGVDLSNMIERQIYIDDFMDEYNKSVQSAGHKELGKLYSCRVLPLLRLTRDLNNSYNALVEALQAYVSKFGNCGATYDEARAALKLARGE